MISSYKNFLVGLDMCPFLLERYLLSSSYLNESLNFKISSLQIVVPTKGCINDCKSCIAKISNEFSFKDESKNINFLNKYLDNLKKIREVGCKTMVLTGIGEAIQNKKFLRLISELNNKLDDPFDIEIQTTGVLLNDENINFLKNIIGVKVISLSIFDIFDNLNNLSIIGVKEKLKFDIVNVCKKIKNIGLILRISLNLINVYDKHSVIDIFNKIDEIQPNQLTFRSLWFTDDDNPINKWIKSNNCSYGFLDKIKSFLSLNGRKVRESVYIYNGISIYLNEDCMKVKGGDSRYLILRTDNNVYQSWEDKIPIKL